MPADEMPYLVTRTQVTWEPEGGTFILLFKINLAFENGADFVVLHSPTNRGKVFTSKFFNY